MEIAVEGVAASIDRHVDPKGQVCPAVILEPVEASWTSGADEGRRRLPKPIFMKITVHFG